MSSAHSGNTAQPSHRRGEAVRRAVLDATAAELLIDGPATTVGAIARRANVHETSIYRRWGTREALLLESASEQTRTAFTTPDTGSLHGDLIELCTGVERFVRSAIGVTLVRLAQDATTPGERRAVSAFWSDRRDDRHRIFDRAVARGEMADDVDAADVMWSLVGAIHLRSLLEEDPFGAAGLERLVARVLAGVGPRD